jgi:catechol 2,3-dioxygenase-like lactoylglutathione lyase family enzyme
MTTKIPGIHHITAICSDAQTNVNFYAGILGLRLVKRTVNFDDPGTYHLYYGDGLGHPGTILTFFAWPGAQRGRIGTGQVTSTSFAVPQDSLDYWRTRLHENNIEIQSSTRRFGDEVLTFADPDGMVIELIASQTTNPDRAYTESAVPAKHAIRGFHSATFSETSYQATSDLLSSNFGFKLLAQEGSRLRYTLDSSEAGTIIDVLDNSQQARGHVAVGTVHHIAFRTLTDDDQAAWLQSLTRQGYRPSEVMDRVYFHSIYFREPGGILFEIATDAPGFTFDESPEELGSNIMLPPWLERSRAPISRQLAKLEIPEKASVVSK